MKKEETNVLFISHYSDMYGANQSLCTLMVELKDNYQIKPIVLLRNHGPICKFMDQHGIKYYIFYFFWWVYEGNGFKEFLLSFTKQLRNIPRIIHIYKTIRTNKIRLVYTNGLPANIGLFLSKLLGCPHIWHIRESIEHFKFKFSLGKFISKIILKNAADKYILISDYLVNAYSGLLPLRKIVRIYNGIELPKTNTKSKKESETFNLCMLGIISEQKNNLDAIKALAILRNQKLGVKVILHLAGGRKQEYLELLRIFIYEHDLIEYVRFYEHINDPRPLLSRMDLGLICSRDEAFGRVSIEFMMHRIPVIASNSGANNELVKKGINGEIYELYNSQELADKIIQFIEKPELLKSLGQSAYDYAISNFSSSQNTKYVYKIIEEIIN